MRRIAVFGMLMLAGMVTPLVTSLATPGHAQGWQMPPEDQRCPSKWGAGDQRGSGNLMQPASIVRAARLIKTGESFELGALLSPDPKEAFINAGRVFNIYTKPSPPIQNARQVNEELVITELGQIGTQLDAFAHQMWGDSFYNCFKLSDIGTRSGFKKLGVENVGGLITRGVLIDVAGLKGVDMLPTSYSITPDDLRGALAMAGQTLRPGDAVIIRTGWSKLMGKDNHRYGTANPGIGIAAGQWLVTQDPNADRSGQLLHRSETLRAAAQLARSRHDADPARHLSTRKFGAGRAGHSTRLRIFVHRPAVENQRRHRLSDRTDCYSLTRWSAGRADDWNDSEGASRAAAPFAQRVRLLSSHAEMSFTRIEQGSA